VGRGRGQHLLPLLDPYPPQRVAGFRANACAILPLLWNRQRIACLLFREALGSRGPRSGLPLGTVAGVVGFVDGRALRVGAAEEEGRESRGVLLSELGRFCSARHAACPARERVSRQCIRGPSPPSRDYPSAWVMSGFERRR
jgi:hypothetical protein